MNKPDTKLEECIYVAEKVIPPDLCDSIVETIETRPWKPNEWYNSELDRYKSYETMEPSMQFATPELHRALSPFIIESGKRYNKIYSFPSEVVGVAGQMMSRFSEVRFNRYESGQIFRQHYDHIHSLFDGEVKGVPVLTFILNFNDDYEGADLYFWKDTVAKLGKGDICMFPSNWLFPHGVTEATKGKRYSGVTWGW